MKKIIAPLFVVSLMALSGCGASSEPEAAPTSASPTISVPPAAPETSEAPTPSPTPTPTPTRNVNERDQLLKEIGESAWTELEDGTRDFTMKVTSIEPIECDNPYATPANGTALAVHLEVETDPSFEGPITVNGQPNMISFSPYYWKGYADNGTRMNTLESDMSQNCLADQSRKLPDFIGKGEKVNGLVVLDVASPSGSVAFEPWGSPGWIWEYPSK